MNDPDHNLADENERASAAEDHFLRASLAAGMPSAEESAALWAKINAGSDDE